MRALLGLIGGLGLLGLAAAVGPKAREDEGPRERRAALLGPLRPVVAELRWLQTQVRWWEGDRLGYLEEVREVLALRPDVPEQWAEFAAQMMLDLPRHTADLEEQRRWFEEGYDLLVEGLLRHPDSVLLWLSLSRILLSVAEVHPHRLEGHPAQESWPRIAREAAENGESLVELRTAWWWHAIELQASLGIRALAADPEDGAARARMERLLGLPLDDALRDSIQGALDGTAPGEESEEADEAEPEAGELESLRPGC